MADMARTGQSTEMTCRTSIWTLVKDKEHCRGAYLTVYHPRLQEQGRTIHPELGSKECQRLSGFV